MDGSVNIYQLAATVGTLLPLGAVVFAILRSALLHVMDKRLAETMREISQRTMSRELLEEKFSYLYTQHRELSAALAATESRRQRHVQDLSEVLREIRAAIGGRTP